MLSKGIANGIAIAVCLGTHALTTKSADAGLITVGFDNGSGLAATATFDDRDSVVGAGVLQVTLSNVGSDVTLQNQVLTAVFFDIAGSSTLSVTGGSAMLAAGSTVLFGTENGGNVGPEWAYAYASGGLGDGGNAAADPVTQSHGISSSGFGLFSSDDRFDTSTDLDSPESPNGVNYGITSIGDDPLTGQSKVTGDEPLIKYSVVFTLTGWTGDIGDALGAPGGLESVRFQYGTSLNPQDDPSFPAQHMPEPTSIVLLGLGFAGLSGRRLIRRKVG